MLAVHAVCADTDAEADRLRACADLFYERLARDPFRPGPLVDPDTARAELGAAPEPTRVLPGSWPARLSGSPDHLHEVLTQMMHATGADELMIQDLVPESSARHRSYELLATMIDHPAPLTACNV
jgi:alkanesulfonate monooxygenase SsuD/methylene tetrahydromethanopterin reductase-like flavin-dependent oxidoreductase (luciferase family)